MGIAAVEPPPEVSTEPPDAPCDVIMKGGVTSGVIYPWALVEFGRAYRLRGLGGASAGAIGAALGAAAEYGRSAGGFDVLRTLPGELGDGKLGRLFQPQRRTRSLFRVLLAATGHDRPGASRGAIGRALSIVAALLIGFPIATLLGALPGAWLLVRSVQTGDDWLTAAAAVLVLVGFGMAMIIRLAWILTRTVPRNLFGICRGIAVGKEDGLTDWLSDKIDAAAGLGTQQQPLTFGQLTAGGPDRRIDLRMVTTCLTQGTPYELPLQSHQFFYDPTVWRTLFPDYVMRALDKAPPGRPERLTPSETAAFASDEAAGAAHDPKLRRLPAQADLPVIVATRLSLSFPLLISAVPIWIVEHYRGAPTFRRHWFTDGGFCSNFPVHMFDSALPAWPTFAINLRTMGKSWRPSADQCDNLSFVTSNRGGLSRPYRPIPDHGFAAVAGFAAGAFDTSRNWSDNSYLRYPGYRDRIVAVRQSTSEGGLNLFMDSREVYGLADRGRTAAQVLVQRFTTPQFAKEGEEDLTLTAWDNHRWTRYRALLSALPTFLTGFAAGRAALSLDPSEQRSYPLSQADHQLAEAVLGKLDDAATTVATAEAANPAAIRRLTDEPNPQAVLRRIPQI